MPNTLCPYSAKPLSDIGEVNGEHILPSGLGAPDSFTVPCGAKENAAMNERIDAPFLNMALIKLIGAGQGVSSRSGDLTAHLRGTVKATREQVKAVLSQNDAAFSFMVPVDTNSDGHVTRVKGFGKAADAMAKQVQKNYAKKGMKAELGPVESLEDSSMHFREHLDLTLLRQQLTKIAYLMTVRVFGDDAITSPSGTMFRASIDAKTVAELEATGIQGGALGPIPPGFPQVDRHEHAITTVHMPNMGILTAVTLYGTFSALYVTPTNGITAPELTGEVVVIDASTGTLRSEHYLDALPRLMRGVDGL